MKKTYYIIVCSLFLLGSCTKSPEQKAKSILEKAIQAHGGQEAWDQLETLKFRKWTRLLLEDGSVESETDQLIELRMKPYLEGSISWVSDSIEHISSFNGSTMSYTMGGNSVKNQGFLQSKKKDFDAAYYVIAQPWKLLEDEGASLFYEGQKELASGQLAEIIRVNYGPENDVWWYYFDPVSYQMLGNEVQLKDHRSLVENDTMEQAGPFLLYGKRTSYRVNEQGEKLYVRAEYQYSDFEITLEK
ncbi:hypothetical protein JYB62_08065 [Algoriphagus lutimaris]|uniref:hypothetical protein n=1 Tax=Algoriphagus lutimaris TaxID=613197 RepID=UPI00196ABA24|nr:hypothetical protein [Algoriphagus lutimaris]MBN3519956.1 hypothetical protein [Algoriphagus lutimaris]